MYLFVFHWLFLLGASAAVGWRLFARLPDRILVTVLLACTNLVVTCLLLSGLHRLGDSGWFLRASLGLAAATWFALRRNRPVPAPPDTSATDRVSPRLVAFFVLTLVPIAWVGVRIGSTYLPNNYDSLAYHLPRTMFYLGQNTLAHFDTGNDRQVYFPFNYNLLQLSGLTYGPPLQTLNFFNLAAWVVAGLAIHRLCRLAACTANASLLATWLALTSTQILAQATATTNDLPTAAGLLCALVFGLRWRTSRLTRDALFAGIAAGLTAGSKLTIIFFGPAAALIGLGLAWQFVRRGETRALLQGLRSWVVPAVLAFLLAAPFALINLAEKGQWVTKTYDYTLNRPFSLACSAQTAKAYLFQLFVEPVHRFTFDQGFTEKLNAWGQQTFFPHWNEAYAFSPLYLFPPDLNEDHVWFGFAGPFILLAAGYCLLRFRRVPSSQVWLAVLGLGWFATYFLLNKWSLYNQRYFVLAILVLSPCLGTFLGAGFDHPLGRRVLRFFLPLLVISTLWMTGVYLFKNTSRPYAPLWAGQRPPPALPAMPPPMVDQLSGYPRINIDSSDGNERTFLLMTHGAHQRFVASAKVQPDCYNVFSEWGFPRKVAYSNIEQRSSYTIVPIPTKPTVGVEFLGTIGTGQPALDYYGLAPHPEQQASIDRNRNVMVKFSYAAREPDRYAHMQVKVAGLNDADQARLHVEVEYEDNTVAPLATFTTTGEAPAPVTKPFRRLILRVEDRNTGAKIGGTEIPYRFRSLPPEIEAPDDPTLLFVDELVLPKPDPHATSTGLAVADGPYPQWELPLIRWAKAPVVRVEIADTEKLARLELVFSVRLEARSSAHLDVVFNGELIRDYQLEGSSNWTTQTVPLTPRPGPNVLEIRNVSVSTEPDWLDYLERYPDVKNYVVSQNIIPLEKGAQQHYEGHGKRENRVLHFKRHTETIPDAKQLYYLFRTLRINGFRNP